MGFSSVGSFIVMFFAMLIMISSVFMIYGSLLDNSMALNEMQTQKQKVAQTSISIINATIDKSNEEANITIDVVNDGRRMLDLDDVDIYVDGYRVPRNEESRTIGFISSNDINPLHWDPGEIIQINTSLELTGDSHRAVVATEFGITDSTVFS